MHERRLFHQLSLLFFLILSCFLLYHLFSIQPVEQPFHQNLMFIPHSESYNYTYPTHLLASNDYTTLVNYSFTFDRLNTGCNDSTLLLILIHSSPGNFRKRTVLRSTWAQKNEWTKILFVMGRTENETIQKELTRENDSYGDLIQGSFLDTYRNLTYKHITCLKYAIYHCPQAKYILKCDDDIFVNMPLLKNFLNFDLSPFGVSNAILCPLKHLAPVLRTYRSKWRVSFEEYPERTYPDYCLGWAILYSPDVIFQLYKSAQNSLNIFWIDDVYITGTMVAKINVFHTDISDLVITWEDQKYLVSKNGYPRKDFLLGRPDLTESELRALWKRVTSLEAPKSIWRRSVAEGYVR